MLQKIYEVLIRPRSNHPDRSEREVVLNFLLLGMLGLCVAAVLDTIAVYFINGYHFLLARIFAAVIICLLFGGLYFIARFRERQALASGMLTMLAFGAASIMVYQWGLLVPTALVLFSLVIVMAGVLHGARSSLYVSFAIVVVFVILQYAKTKNVVQPDLTWMSASSTYGDVIGFSALFLTIALVSWLFNRQMELSLKRARRAEAALQRQNEQLEVKVARRTRELEKEQMEKVQQMYRFAELGHVSTALFHDLANHVSSVSLDIENLQRGGQSDILARIDENIHYIDTIVRRVRSQLKGKHPKETIDVENEIREVAKVLLSGLNAKNIELTLRFPTEGHPRLRGDVLRFRQIILNLLSNAVESYGSTSRRRPVSLEVATLGKELLIAVSDQGMGIARAQQDKIFDPFYTSKEQGVGIGLFIVKRVIERDFNGRVGFASSKAGTIFTVHLPLRNHVRS